MADMIVTISSSFGVADLDRFLAESGIQDLRKHFVDPENSPTGEAGYFHATRMDESTGRVSFGGYCGLPDGDEWKRAIQRHISGGERMRVSTAGFDSALKYTIAAAYDIDCQSVTPVDASYGSLLGHEWYTSLPEVVDPREPADSK